MMAPHATAVAAADAAPFAAGDLQVRSMVVVFVLCASISIYLLVLFEIPFWLLLTDSFYLIVVSQDATMVAAAPDVPMDALMPDRVDVRIEHCHCTVSLFEIPFSKFI